MSLPALVLAGGQSRRMGRDKALLPFDSTTLVGYIANRLIHQGCQPVILNRSRTAAVIPGFRVVEDAVPGHQGPLAGILAGLGMISDGGIPSSHMVVVPVDSPFFPDDFVARMKETGRADHAAIVVARYGEQPEPVFSLWPISVLSALSDWLDRSNDRSIKGFLRTQRVLQCNFGPAPDDASPFFNINTADDYAHALARAGCRSDQTGSTPGS